MTRILLGLVACFTLGCSQISRVTGLPSPVGSDDNSKTTLDGREDDPSLTEANEPVSVGGSFLVCVEDPSVTTAADQIGMGCRLEGLKHNKQVLPANGNPVLKFFDVENPRTAESPSEITTTVVDAPQESYWHWHITQSNTIPLPKSVLLSIGVDSWIGKVVAAEKPLSLLAAFHLGDNTDPLASNVTVTAAFRPACETILNQIYAQPERQVTGKSITTRFKVNGNSSRIIFYLRGICGLETVDGAFLSLVNLSTGLEVKRITIPFDDPAKFSTKHDFSTALDVAKGSYELTFSANDKATGDLDDFVIEEPLIQRLIPTDVDTTKASFTPR